MSLNNVKYDQPCMSESCKLYLESFIRDNFIRHVLEYGSGGSTFMFSELVGENGKVVSYEDNLLFYQRIFDKLPKNVTLHRTSKYYHHVFDESEMYHFVFIDGKERIRCMRHAAGHFKYIAIHDSEREEYKPGYVHIIKRGYKDISPEGINIKVFEYVLENSYSQ